MIIERNDEKIDFKPTPYRRGDKALNKQTYLAPDINEQTLDSVIKFLGKDTLVSWVGRVFSGFCQRANELASEGGAFSAERFADIVKDLTAQTEKISVLVEKQQALIKQLATINMASPDALKQVTELSNELNRLAITIENRKRAPRTADEEEE
ncbi:MAG TPA: hypothetical protein VL854_11915 [Nitrososphaeraceae archaeon]|nr:hypothetical protein [Nitrososphaeraceae archaeon]